MMVDIRVSPKAASRRGFTLTELAIVLGIIGLILGAIWTAASKVYANNRVAKSVQQVLAIASGVRGLYTGKGTFPTGGADLTTAMASFGVYPSDMLQTACPAASGVTYSPCPVDVWGTGAVTIGTQTGWNGAPVNAQRFEIRYFDPTMKDCPAFLGQMLNQATQANMTWAYATGAAGDLTSPTTDAMTNASGCTGAVVMQFSL